MEISPVAGERRIQTNDILMSDDAVFSSASPECGTPSASRLGEGSLVQPGVFVPNLPDPLEGAVDPEAQPKAWGGYSEVYRGTWTRPSGGPIPVAIKRLRRAYLISEAEYDRDRENYARFETRIKREVVVWQAAKHAHILEFYGYTIIGDDPALVSPWCENGNLRQYTSTHPKLTGVKKLNLLHDAALGLAHLHSLRQPIIHGDVKPENIMITNEVKGVLCDFGVSRVIIGLGMRTGLTSVNQCSGTVGFQAKELHEEDSQPTTMCDVYAFGGVILTAMSGNGPFYRKLCKFPGGVGATILAIAKNKTPSPSDHPELPESDRLWRLMKDCWSPEPSQRPDMSTLCGSLQKEIDDRSIPAVGAS